MPNGDLDTTFNTNGEGSSQVLNTLLVLQNGKILIGGGFSTYNGVSKSWMARLFADGSLDPSFNVNLSGAVYKFIEQPDGKILIYGLFQNLNGSPIARLARLNPDGSTDVSFSTGAGFSGDVYDMMLQPDGKIMISGGFASFNGIPRKGIVRLNPNGSVDQSFNAGTGPNSLIYSIVLHSNGKYYITGPFTSFNGMSIGGMVCLNEDGSLYNSFNIGPGANGIVIRSFEQPDGRMLVWGHFTQFNSTPVNGFLRILPSGTIDASFYAGTGAEIDGIHDIAPVDSERYMIVGYFTSYNNVGRNRIARIFAHSITLASTPLAICNNHSFSLPFQTGTLQTGNVFTAQLSDAQGSFDNPINIGTLQSGTAGNIDVTIPQTIPGGTGYLIRIVSSSPYLVSTVVPIKFNTPQITTQPQPQAICAGAPLTLSVTVGGSGPFTYNWSKDGAPIPGATGATLQIASVSSASAGSYKVEVANGCGTVVSSEAVVTVNLNSGCTTSITNLDPDISSASLTPTLVNSVTTLRMQVKRKLIIDWSLIDSKGQLVQGFQQKIMAGSVHEKELNLASLPNGMYHLYGATSNGKTIVLRLVKF